MKLIIKTQSERLWWGIYGLTTKNGWEDFDLYDDQGKFIDKLHLNTKSYLRAGLKFLQDDALQLDYAIAIKDFLQQKDFRFWYYYDHKNDPDLYEVPYDAPKNKEGLRPKAIEIWHPDERIGIDTIVSAGRAFSNRFLSVKDCEVKIEPPRSIEELIKSYNNSETPGRPEISDKTMINPELIFKLSKLWNR